MERIHVNNVMIAIARSKTSNEKIILTGDNLISIAQLAVFNQSVVEQAWHISPSRLFEAMKELEANGFATSDKQVKSIL